DPKPASEVYWIEEFTNPHRALIRCAPRDSGAVLAERFHPQMSAAVFVSSSLALADQLGFFCRQAGLEPAHAARVRTAAVRGQGVSRKVAPLLLSRFTPMLAGGKAMETVADMLARSLRALGCPAFVHFTHVGLLKQARARLGEALAKDGRLVAAQHVDGSRDSLLHLFRHRKDACLLGTDAFVDGLGAGDTLPEVVAITKLPFPVPSEPLVAAALERIQEAGENPLYDFLLPSAILRLKQELGRLPRPASGRLALWILDPRLCTEKYARAFLRGLGRESATCASEEDLMTRTRDLWEGRGLPVREAQVEGREGRGGGQDGQGGDGAPGGQGGPRDPGGHGRRGQKGQGGQGRPPRRGPPGESRQGGPRGPGGQGRDKRGPRGPKGPGNRDEGRGQGTPDSIEGVAGIAGDAPHMPPPEPTPREGMPETLRPEGDRPADIGSEGTA
ncbi:MAG TPA: helicase C-terminal domain-containing protein, partial [Fibrobacteria bacterium]|nr:helicase C-terminal domain-containing protein [Fibrobacteria bacterium]